MSFFIHFCLVHNVSLLCALRSTSDGMKRKMRMVFNVSCIYIHTRKNMTSNVRRLICIFCERYCFRRRNCRFDLFQFANILLRNWAHDLFGEGCERKSSQKEPGKLRFARAFALYKTEPHNLRSRPSVGLRRTRFAARLRKHRLCQIKNKARFH